MSEEIKKREAVPVGLGDQEQAELEKDPLTRRETLKLVSAYYRNEAPAVPKCILGLVNSMADVPGPEPVHPRYTPSMISLDE